LICRIRGRDAFGRLSRDGRRIRRPALWCSWCPDTSSTTTAVGFALGRAIGPAVTRNRIRRRLRAICRELDAAQRLPSGLLLLGANPRVNELTFDDLRREVQMMLDTIQNTRTPATRTPG
jgi:ribonuclease P protein component